MVDDAILDTLVRLFQSRAAVTAPAVLPVAQGLVTALFTLGLSWDLVAYALLGTERAFPRAIRRFVIFLLAFGAITLAPAWIATIPESFTELGRLASGIDGLAPSAVLGQGLDLGLTLFASWDRALSAVVGPFGELRLVTFLLVVLSFAVLAFQMARVLIELAFALGGFLVFLGFFGHAFTFGIAEAYLRYVFELGVRLYVVFLVVAVGRDLGREWDATLQGLALFDLRLHLLIVLSALFLALLAWALPKEIGARLAGGLSFAAHNPLRSDA